ncbi:hypothetical protein Dimus_034362 [Dionaea muscipula]
MSLPLSSHPSSISSKPSSQYHSLFSLPLSITLCLPRNPNPFIAAASASSSTADTLPKSPIQRIVDKLRSLGFVEDTSTNKESIAVDADSNAGEIFILDPRQLPNHRVGHTLDPSWSTPHNLVQESRRGPEVARFVEMGEVEGERNAVKGVEKEKKVLTKAELELPAEELRRLRTIGIKLKKILKVGKAGITEGIVNGIHERWRSSEVVKVSCEDIWGMNMKRTHDLLERKTGGMVVWRAGSKIVLYRGVDYKYPYFSLDEASTSWTSQSMMKEDRVLQHFDESHPFGTDIVESSGSSLTRKLAESSLTHGVGHPNRVRLLMPGEQQLVDEADHLLDGLGPRFTGWWGCDPLPVDADLLPPVLPGYRRPFRLLPYGVKPNLTNAESRVLKRLGGPLPCHFAVGRNRDLHGLAAAIVKLWEKSELAKVAVKRGVLKIDSKVIAEELKCLTGGLLLSRDQDFIVLYRGKDFLPSAVSMAIEERRKNRMQIDDQRINYGSLSTTHIDPSLVIDLGKNIDFVETTNSSIEVAPKKTGMKLSVAPEMLEAKLEPREIPQKIEINEGITEEERYMLQQVGLRMKPFLLLGRRGVFDGTVENIHLHWKYRELVKIICGGRSIAEAHKMAGILEEESGGILVAVERVSKGFAIIIYRGRNYRRPASLRPRTLINKKEAMKRSLDAQRSESLKLDVLKIARTVEELQPKLVKVNEDGEAKDDQVTPTLLNNDMDSEKNILKTVPKDKQTGMSSMYEGDDNEAVVNSSYGLLHINPRSNFVFDAKIDGGLNSIDEHDFELKGQTSGFAIIQHGSQNSKIEPAEPLINLTRHDFEKSVHPTSKGHSEQHVFKNETLEMACESANGGEIPVFPKAAAHKNNGTQPRATPLSNKERLLLRKEALKMKRRPLFTVDGNNVITGVAKAIREHFRKYPLAIVNVKGRAKGSSVQEVVLKLEQTTGGVLVSQEPSKVILYRGLGAGVGSAYPMDGKDKVDEGKCLPSIPVSPELIAAMKLEYGLPTTAEEATPEA